MSDGKKFLFLLGILIVGGSLVGAGYMIISEFQARAALPAEMRTAEIIQKEFDGAVCLGCETSAYFFIGIAVIVGAAVLVCALTHRASVTRDS
jgi:hypothetical protein